MSLFLAATALLAAAEPPDPELTAADSLVIREAETLTAAERNRDPQLRQEISLRLRTLADSLETAGELRAASTALQASGWSDMRTGDGATARRSLDRAEPLAEASGDSAHVASVLNTSAIIFAMNSEYDEAISRWNRCLEISQANGDLRKQGQALGNMANAYSLAGDLLAARRITDRAVAVDQQCGNEFGVASAHHRMAAILRAMQRYDAAIASTDSAIAIYAKLGSDPSPAFARRAQILFDAGRHEEALASQDRADSLAIAHGNLRLVTSNRGNRARMLSSLGRPDEALALCEETDKSGLVPLDRILFDGYHAMALLQTGAAAEAEDMLLSSVDLFEEIRREEGATAGVALFDRAGSIYACLGAIRLALGRPEEAWATVERGRSAALREHLGAAAADLAAVQAALAGREPAALVEINDGLAGEKDTAFLITVDELRVIEIEVPRAADRENVRDVLTSGTGDAAVRTAFAQLGDGLFRPIVEALPPDVAHLYLVPSTDLTGFPLEQMSVEEGPDSPPLADVVPVTYLPAAWLLPALAGRAEPGGGMVVFADPAPGPGGDDPAGTRGPRGPLPEARREARAVAIGGARIRLGADASPAAFAEAAGNAAVLHFATHAVLDPFRPSKSGLILAGGEPDGLVTAEDVAGRTIPADLVTLSGCRTAGGWTVLGEGTLGLPRAFLAAGARSVVSSLWDVEDAAAARFMEAFYAALRDGVPRDQALARAQGALREAGYPPRDRAAFVLTGLGHAPVETLAGASVARSVPGPRTLVAILVAILGGLGLLLALRGRRAS